jgi:glycosyltransferase involved in cell wall biosynthesis
MRVLHVITSLDSGGAASQLGDLLRHTRHHTEVVSLTALGPVAEQIMSDGIPVTHLGMRYPADLAVLPKLIGKIRRGRFDVVHSHLWRACLYGRFAARAAGCRTIVATEHSLSTTMVEENPFRRPGRRPAYLASERLGHMTVAVSPTVADCLIGCGVRPARIRVIPNGIDLDRFRFDEVARRRVREHCGIDPRATVVGTAGRLVPSKFPDRVLEAVRGLPSVVLLVVGDGPERERLGELARRWGMAERVVFAGQCQDMGGMLAAMDVFASASAHETFGLAVLEALANGLPTVYVHNPGLDQLADRPVPGAHRAGPEVASVRAAIAGLLSAPRRAVLDDLAAYDIRRTATEIDSLYESLRDQRPGGAGHHTTKPREIRV